MLGLGCQQPQSRHCSPIRALAEVANDESRKDELGFAMS